MVCKPGYSTWEEAQTFQGRGDKSCAFACSISVTVLAASTFTSELICHKAISPYFSSKAFVCDVLFFLLIDPYLRIVTCPSIDVPKLYGTCYCMQHMQCD